MPAREGILSIPVFHPILTIIAKEANVRDILPDVETWLAQGKSVAIATVIQTWGSSPRQEGARMAITPDGGISGSVSGGCVEGAVFEAAVESLNTGRPQLLHFGVADESAWDVGLACGGSIEIFVKPLDAEFFKTLRSVLDEEIPAALVTLIRGPDEKVGREILIHGNGEVIASSVDIPAAKIADLSTNSLAEGTTQRILLEDGIEIFIETLLPPPTLVAVGGVHITIALMELAKTLGYRTIVVDPRKAFGSGQRFPHVDRLIQSWPDEAFQQIPITSNTAVAMLTHDPKLDDPALKIALASPAFYVGALGSRLTQNKRRQRLLEDGLTEEQLDRIHGPIGIDIQARTPEEIALSILSEIVAARNKAEA
jgi:xanthine dehydrogenase accessory factor